MSLRITTNGTIHTYKSNLLRSNKKLNDASNKVLTQRNFNSFAEDPASASKAFQMRRSKWATDVQLDNTQTVANKFVSAWDNIDQIINDLGNDMAKVSSMTALSDPNSAGRNALGQTLSTTADSVMQLMNIKYGDEFVFAGADGCNVPFSWGADGNLQYRGINVNGETQADMDLLDKMNEEATYVDMGMGLKEDAQKNIVTSSAFNSALSGIDFLGYGTDKDGLPNNVVSIMKQLGEIFQNCDPDTGAYKSAGDKEKAEKLNDKLSSALSTMSIRLTELDVKSTTLNTNVTRLTSLSDTLNEQIVDVEQCEAADAITELSWAQYCYNAALKIGNTIMSQSLMDYMK